MTNQLNIEVDPDAICECANCERQASARSLDFVDDPGLRLDAGGEVPAGQCPACGALAYLVKATVQGMEPGKRYQAFTPEGQQIAGTLDVLRGRAELNHFFRSDDGKLDWQHNGTTKIFYDDQRPETRDGKPIFLCEDGKTWTEDQLAFRPE